MSTANILVDFLLVDFLPVVFEFLIIQFSRGQSNTYQCDISAILNSMEKLVTTLLFLEE